MSEVERKTGSTGEVVKFGLLALILLGTVVVVALLRPLIFGQIVPAVMGNNEAATTGEPSSIRIPVIIAPDSPTAPAAEPTAVTEPVEATPDEVEMNGETVAPPQTRAPIRHTVQPNENLTHIARHYGVTVEALVAANSIPNPNRIEAGTVLLIPPAVD
jgi:LysM repeat protein